MVLFSWGWTGFGQSGTGLSGALLDQGIDSPTLALLPPHTKLTSLAGGNFHSSCVDTKGNLYTWGNARHGECGHASKESRNGGGGAATVGPDKEEEHIPRRMKMKGVRFKLVACGMYHTVSLTTDQHVFAWGSNELGQLGLGKYGPLSTTKPIRIDALDKASIFAISCGDSFSVAIGLRLTKQRNESEVSNESSELGSSKSKLNYHVEKDKNGSSEEDNGCMIFTWGENNRGQLGRDTDGKLYDKFVGHVKLQPVQMSMLDLDGTASTTSHSAASTLPAPKCDKPHSLSLPSPNSRLLQPSLKRTENHSDDTEAMVFMASCGAEHMLLLTTKGIVYSCGAGSDGQLGLGEYKDVPNPTPVQNFVSRGVVVSKVSAGGNVSSALAYGFNKFALQASSSSSSTSPSYSSSSTSNTSVYMWGSNSEGQLGDGGCGISRRNIPGPCYVGGQYDVIDISLGEDHVVALCKERLINHSTNRTFPHFASSTSDANKNMDDVNVSQHDEFKSDDIVEASDNMVEAEDRIKRGNNHRDKSRRGGKSSKSRSIQSIRDGQGKVVGSLVVWGRSAAGRLGIGDVQAFQSHMVHGKGTTSNKVANESKSSSAAISGRLDLSSNKINQNDMVEEIAFYRSMSAVFLDDSLNFHTPVTVPFNPFQNTRDKNWIQDNVDIKSLSSDSNDEDDEDESGGERYTSSEYGVTAIKDIKLSLRGISTGGAHTLVYATFDDGVAGKKKKKKSKNSKNSRVDNGRGLRSYLDDDMLHEEEDENLLEFPEGQSASSSPFKGSNRGSGGGWKQWKICPREGCNVCLPDELADWHEILCKKAYPAPPIMEAKQEEDGEEAEHVQAAKLATFGDGKTNESKKSGDRDISSHLIDDRDKNQHHHSQLPSLSSSGDYRSQSNSFRTSSLHEMSLKNKSYSLPTISSPSSADSSCPSKLSDADLFHTVKKRIGGGFTYVTVPKTN